MCTNNNMKQFKASLPQKKKRENFCLQCKFSDLNMLFMMGPIVQNKHLLELYYDTQLTFKAETLIFPLK
jgi:hypothetical protein